VNRDIAIIGISCAFPGASSTGEFWQNLREGRDCITQLSIEELRASGVAGELIRNSRYVPAAGVIENYDCFDQAFFRYSPREAELMDPQHRLFLEHSYLALEDAGEADTSNSRSVAVFATASPDTYLLNNLLTHPDLRDLSENQQALIGNTHDSIATRVAYKLNLSGPSMTLQCGCSSSLVAVHFARIALLTHQCDIALVGGVSVAVPHRAGYLYTNSGVVSPDGKCRPFDAQSAGTIFTNGIGVVALKRFTDAQEDGNPIYALIKGSAVNNDASQKIGFSSPSIKGQSEVIYRAMEVAGTPPETIQYIEAHGTGTELGDPVEVEGLTRAFRAKTPLRQFCSLGSVKGNLGHTDVAAGMAGLIKTCLMLKNKEMVPSIHFEQPNPRIDFSQTPFRVITERRSWPESKGIPRRAGVSSFGVGGTNAHVILEESPAAASRPGSKLWNLFPLSAHTENALCESVARLLRYLHDNPQAPLASISQTLIAGRRPMAFRQFYTARTQQELMDSLRQPVRPVGASEPARNLVFIFPGQGAQHANMARGLYAADKRFQQVFDECCEHLKPGLGRDLRTIILSQEPDVRNAETELEQTLYTQTSLFVVEYALALALMERGLRPSALLGHSVGEYVAAALSGILNFRDALDLVQQRGRLQQSAVPGAMLSVPLSPELVHRFLCPDVNIAAWNAESLTVLSGKAGAIAEIEAHLKQQGIHSTRLRTSHAFHSLMMDPILEDFRCEVKRVRFDQPGIPIISNLTGEPLTAEEAKNPEYWVRHLRETVRFFPAVQYLVKHFDPIFLEVGPGRALSSILKEIAGGAPVFSMLPHRRQPDDDAGYALNTLGQLWALGQPVDWKTYWKDEKPRRVSLPAYPFEKQHFWIDANHAPQSHELRPGSLMRSAPENWLHVPTWKRALPPKQAKADCSSWLIFSDGEAGSELSQHLRNSGHQVTEISPTNDGEGTGYRHIFENLLRQNAFPVSLVYLLPLKASQAAAEQRFMTLVEIMLAAESVSPKTIRHLYVGATHVFQLMRQDNSDPYRSTVIAAARGISQEFPHVRYKVIEVEPDTSQAEVVRQLAGELNSTPDQDLVAYRGGSRWEQAFDRVTAEPARRDVSHPWSGRTFVITGGLGKLGMAHADYLANLPGTKIALIGRTALPRREEWPRFAQHQDPTGEKIRRILDMESRGAKIEIHQGDVTNLELISQIWERVQASLGNVFGLIHVAGVAGTEHYCLLKDESLARSARLFAPKVKGTEVMAQVVREHGTELCMVVSSISSVLGGLGLSAYSASHIFLDSYVHQAQLSEQMLPTKWQAVNWDAWALEESEGAHTGENNALGSSLQRLALSAEEAGMMLDRLCNLPHVNQIIISTAALNDRYRAWVKRQFEGNAPVTERKFRPRPPMSSTYKPAESAMEQDLLQIWQDLLGISDIGTSDNFFELGGDSLLALRMVTAVNEKAAAAITVLDVFEHPTIGSLSASFQPDPKSDLSASKIDQRTALQREAILRKRMAVPS